MKEKKSKLKLIHTVVCEDVRREDNGKMLLVGVFPDGILLHEMPVTLYIALWMHFHISVKGKILVEIKIEGNNLEDKITIPPIELGDDTLHKNAIGVAPIAIGRIPLKVKSEGEVLVSYREEGKKWKLARHIKIIYKSKPV